MQTTDVFDIFDPRALAEAVRILTGGGVVAVPTETVYGLAAHGLRADGVSQIYHIKGRPICNPLILHVHKHQGSSLEALQAQGLIDLTQILPGERKLLESLMADFWPGPLTLIFPKGHRVPLEVTGGQNTVAIRVPAHEGFLHLLAQIDFPLAAPSANRYTRISSTCAAHVYEEFSGSIPLILDGGPCGIGVESTIARVVSVEPVLEGAGIHILRPGGVSGERLGTYGVVLNQATHISALSLPPSPVVPGTALVHYAPRKPLYIWHSNLPRQAEQPAWCSERTGLILWSPQTPLPASFPAFCGQRFYFSHDGQPEQVAAQLFSMLRHVDHLPGIDSLCVLPTPTTEGLWAAIADRLRRASMRVD